jgi:hypothetical protein
MRTIVLSTCSIVGFSFAARWFRRFGLQPGKVQLGDRQCLPQFVMNRGLRVLFLPHARLMYARIAQLLTGHYESLLSVFFF